MTVNIDAAQRESSDRLFKEKLPYQKRNEQRT